MVTLNRLELMGHNGVVDAEYDRPVEKAIDGARKNSKLEQTKK